MKIWIHIDGTQLGPFDLTELPMDRMTAETPVWYEGLKYWEPAGKAAVTAPLFAGGATAQPSEVQSTVQSEPQNRQFQSQTITSDYRQSAAAVGQQDQPCPHTYFIWTLIITLLTFNPIGIVTLILGALVRSKYRNYDYEGARRMSETTAWWFMVTIVTSLIFTPFSWIISL